MTALENEKKLISIIQTGDVKELDNMCLRSSEANRPITIFQEIKIINHSQQCPFRFIRSPTILVLAILCEQSKMLKYILETFKPDLSQKINGWAPIHYACCTGSYECLKILLQYQFIQENIDQSIDSPQITENPTQFTTALHIAVSNHRHAQVLLLTGDMPDILYGSDGTKLDSPKPSDYQSANIDQLSAHGNSALQIAAKIRDVDMVKILLAAGADSSLLVPSHQVPEIAEILDNPELEIDDDLLRETYFTEAEEDELDNETKRAEKSKEDEKGSEEYVPLEEVAQLHERIDSLVGTIQLLNTRLQVLEAKENSSEKHICSRCAIETNNKCEICGEYYCVDCLKKPPHECYLNK